MGNNALTEIALSMKSGSLSCESFCPVGLQFCRMDLMVSINDFFWSYKHLP